MTISIYAMMTSCLCLALYSEYHVGILAVVALCTVCVCVYRVCARAHVCDEYIGVCV